MPNPFPFRLPPTLLLALGLAATPALAQANPRAHQHGHAELQAAFDGPLVDLLLESPAYNLLGFEHQPRTAEQKQKLDDLHQWLAGNALINTEDGRCRVVTSELHTGWEEADAHAEHGHPQHDHDHAHDNHTNHSDLEVTQSLHCEALSDAPAFATPLLEQFPALEHLNVQWVSAQGQGGTRLTRSDNRFRPGQ